MKYAFIFLSLFCASQFVFSAKRIAGDYPIGTSFLKAEPNAKRFTGDLGALPTGCPNFIIEQPVAKKSIIVDAAEFGVSEEIEDNTAALTAALNHCKKIDASKLIVKKGVYKFFAKKGELSGIDISGFKDFILDANNALFIYRKDSFPNKRNKPNIKIENCSRIIIQNLNMDWDWEIEPLGSIVEVIGLDNSKEKPYLDFKFLHYKIHPYYNKEINFTSIHSYDTKDNAYGIEGRLPINGNFAGMKNITSCQWLSPNSVRCFFSNPTMVNRAKLGYTYRALHFYYDCNAFTLSSNDNMILKNIHIYSCKGMGIIVNDSQRNWGIENFIIAPKEGLKKYCVSCTADSLHISRSLGNFYMENCKFLHGVDDCINIHDSTEYVSRINDYTIRVPRIKNKKYHTIDSIFELRYADYKPTNFISKAIRIEASGNTFDITFDKKLPNDNGKGFVLFNRKYWSKNFSAKNCVFGYTRARGMIIATDNCTIENCEFKNIHSGAIKIEAGYCPAWAEGYGVDNIVIKNCVFTFPNRLGSQTHGMPRDIMIGMYLLKDNSKAVNAYPMLKNILFEGNKFVNQMGLVAFMNCCDNVIFKDNVISNPQKLLKQYATRGGFYAIYSKNIKIVNNTFEESPHLSSPMLGYDSNNVENIIFTGNKKCSSSKTAK